MEITIPTKLSEVPLYRMVEYNALEAKGETERAIMAVAIFTGLTYKETSALPLKVLNRAIKHITGILEERPELQTTFTYKGIEYGFIPNLDDLTTGEFIDIENYQKEPKDLYKVMSVLYRPIKEKSKKRYLIEPYKGEINEAFKDMPSDVAFGAQLFFYLIATDLLNFTKKYLEEAKAKRTNTDLTKSGDGWVSSIYSLEEMSQSLTKLVNYPFIQISCGRLTNRTWGIWKEILLKKHNDE